MVICGTKPFQVFRVLGPKYVNNKTYFFSFRIYEFLLILSKDTLVGTTTTTRRAMAKIELALGEVPAPIAEIKCVNDELCFPKFGGVFVNPTSRHSDLNFKKCFVIKFKA